MKQFIMTVDVDPPFSSKQNYVIERGIACLLDIFDRYLIRATFFVPGVVAKEFPKIMEEIVQRKHEIACHGLKHTPSEATLDVNKQMEIINTATKIIESTAGLKPVGFRAPLFRTNKNCWIALSRNKYLYDSSVVLSPLFGMSFKMHLQSQPYFLFKSKVSQHFNLLEIPISVNPFLPFPLGGGWLRIFGLKWAKAGIEINFALRSPVIFYIHPKDLINLDTYGLPWYMYRNTSVCLKTLTEIIEYVKQNGGRFIKAYELAHSILAKDERDRPSPLFHAS
ncbi:MAG: polysaccharide deacetylase family protein [Candidatus Bathyarchaeia archaeon]